MLGIGEWWYLRKDDLCFNEGFRGFFLIVIPIGGLGPDWHGIGDRCRQDCLITLNI